MNPTPKQASGYRGGFVGKVAAPLHLLAFILEASFGVFRRFPIKLIFYKGFKAFIDSTAEKRKSILASLAPLATKRKIRKLFDFVVSYSNNMKNISCIIPAHNEEKLIGNVLKIVKKAKKEGLIEEIIVISDGSIDKTAEIAQEANIDKVIVLNKNIGKGGAVIKGMTSSKYDNILMLDADLTNLTVHHIRQMIEPFFHHDADMVIGFLSDDNWQIVLPQFSGQRVFKKSSFKKIIDSKKFINSRYSFELLLHRFTGKSKLKSLYIPLSGLSHIRREVKYGNFKTFLTQAGFFTGVVNTYKYYLIGILSAILLLLIYLIFFSPIRVSGINFSTLPALKDSDKILIVVAHPDDESIGTAGLIKDAKKAGAEVNVVIVTNGDANRWSTSVQEKNWLPKGSDFVQEGKSRMDESKTALKSLGLDEQNIIFLGFPDGNLRYLLNKNWDDNRISNYTKWSTNNYDGTYKKGVGYSGKNLDLILKEIVTQKQPNIIISHSIFDKNPDHRAVYSLTKIAHDELEAREIIDGSKLYSFLVHSNIYNYPHPLRYQANDPLYPPQELRNNCDWTIYPLSSETEKTKDIAIHTYKSQLTGGYLRFLLPAFVRTNELFCPVN
ncbi:MAG: PIG-L family deacetylase [Candidatus Berkelbacteria bacterium]|nr:PIG-L family deacetylase [Candidatus Berkelbacteria bacterium]